MKHSKLSYSGEAILAAALFGASAPLIKLLLGQDTAPIPLAALLYLGSGLSAVLFRSLLRRQPDGRAHETGLSKSDLPWLLGAILAGGVAAPILLLLGLERTPGATASLLLNFETVTTTLIAVLVFKESIGKRIWLAVAAITAASILLSWNGAAGWGFSMGALAVLAACFLWGIDNNCTRSISSKDPLTIVLYKGLGAGAFSTLLAFILRQPFPDARRILFALLIGVFCYGLSITLFILALRGMGASRTSVLYSSAPFIGSLISFGLLREALTVQFTGALAVMLLGAWLLLNEDHDHEHVHEAVEHDHRHCHDDGHHAHDHPGEVIDPGVSHAHPHRHASCAHCHPHLPDIHHRHLHDQPDAS